MANRIRKPLTQEALERQRENARRWRAEHPDRVREYNAKYRADNKEKMKQLHDDWLKAHPNKTREYYLNKVNKREGC